MPKSYLVTYNLSYIYINKQSQRKIMVLADIMKKNIGLKEYTKYHPEVYTNNHIALCVLKAQAFYKGDINLVMTALLHDLWKYDGGAWVNVDGVDYWQNRNHAKIAHDNILGNDDISYMIKSFGGDYNLVANMCKYHMSAKSSYTDDSVNLAKGIIDKDLILDFADIDDMVDRKGVKSRKGSLKAFKNHTVSFVGMSPIQIHFKSNQFTVTVDRTPLRFNFSDIPNLVGGDVGDMLKNLF